jgi:hypothetical protein
VSVPAGQIPGAELSVLMGIPAACREKRKNAEFAPLPPTLKRSPQKAQDTCEETLESAENEYAGDEARAGRLGIAKKQR